jgi:hypothetical protein
MHYLIMIGDDHINNYKHCNIQLEGQEDQIFTDEYNEECKTIGHALQEQTNVSNNLY